MTRLGIWRYVAGAGICGLLWYVAFRRGDSVPLLEMVDLAFHETGRLLTYAFPEVVNAMAGSVVQVAVPLGLGLYFLLIRRDLLGAGLCFAWAATSTHAVSTYIADPSAQHGQLLGGGQNEWAVALGRDHLDVLNRSASIAKHVRDGGLVLAVLGFVLCVLGPLVEAMRSGDSVERWTEAHAAEFVWSPGIEQMDVDRPERAAR